MKTAIASLILTVSALTVSAAVSPVSASSPDPLEVTSHKIAGDGQPALSVFGDKPSIDQVQLFVVSKGWRFERLISRQINVNFGERPKEADVLEFLRRLKRSEFGNAQSGSVFLFGHPTYSPPSPPALKN
ncbi:MAG: hypothetical protein LKF30_00975 [Sphingobium sp.]|jgi:hypothetical protein|nr:hypothetical protein [Sphingobium sp.]MCI1271811.1 hypothetical protein [Sphingobium sp.]MCI2054174.1 hypothetical protein [Sphingobium sp.]